MKKLILLTMLLGLTGCGDNNQSDTTQTNTQASSFQKAEATPAVADYSLAASPRAMGAVAPLAGWNVTKSTVMGGSTLIDAAKDTRISAALITPNAKQVAEVLRGGAAGIALTIAVDQLLGAVDWVMDPVNNQITYTEIKEFTDPNDPNIEIFYRPPGAGYVCFSVSNCKTVLIPIAKFHGWDVISCAIGQYNNIYCPLEKRNNKGELVDRTTEQIFKVVNPNYKPKKLSLETVAEKVISNADAGSLDAQVATNIAAQNILNDVVQAEPVVQELENNARDKDPRCKAIVGEMERLATDVEFRYNDLLLDRHDLYRNYRSIKNAHWSYGSWDGHIIQYNKVQGTLKSLVTRAVIEGCTVSPYVRKWSEQKPPAQPLPKG